VYQFYTGNLLMKPELEIGISNLPDASFKAFRLYQPVFKSHWHYHPEVELVYFSKGKGMKFIGEDISLYNEGDLFLIGENLPHTFVSYQEDCFVESFCIQFPTQIFDSFIECEGIKTLFAEAKRGISFQTIEEDLTEKMNKIVASNGVNALILLMELLELLKNKTEKLPILSENYRLQTLFSEGDFRIRTAIDFINAHYQENISLQKISEECNFSPNAFCRWFKQNMGYTFVDYVNKVRLTHVCQLLISTDFPIAQIASQSGFDNISTFNRLFQQKLNTSPSKYRAGFVVAEYNFPVK
jgi:AraC-like DNA-binding protein/mannose-6-phosphate isomerase-like protein (cupin superfamily)